MSEPDYIVLRPSAGLPPDYEFPDRWNGLWLDRAEVPEGPDRIMPPGSSVVKFVATGRFEVRDDDGAVAEVFEVQSAGPMRPDEEPTT